MKTYEGFIKDLFKKKNKMINISNKLENPLIIDLAKSIVKLVNNNMNLDPNYIPEEYYAKFESQENGIIKIYMVMLRFRMQLFIDLSIKENLLIIDIIRNNFKPIQDELNNIQNFIIDLIKSLKTGNQKIPFYQKRFF